jgi:hypothetical protein
LTSPQTLFFGANDSCHLGGVSKQHVPLPTYRENLVSILSHPLVLAHNPRIILITTPPVDEYQLQQETRSDGVTDRGRSADNARAYAQAGKEVGEALIAQGRQVVVCDLWTALIAQTGWSGEGELPGSLKIDRNPALSDLLHDGIYNHSSAYFIIPSALQLQ